VGGFRLYRFIALGSGASLYWVLLRHCIRFCYITLGSGGSSRDWDPWVQGGLTTPHLYMYRGAERSWFFILFILYIILAGQNQTIIG